MKKYNLGCLLLCLAFVSLDIRAESWMSVDGSKGGECITISDIESSTALYEAKFSVHGIHIDPTEIEGATYQRLTFDIPSTLFEVGTPALPVINKLFALPCGTDFDVSIKDEKWEKLAIGTIYPTQEILYENLGKGDFSINKSIYQSDVFTPALVKKGNLQFWKGIACKSVSVCPFVYYPSSKEILVLREFVLSVRFKQSESLNNLQLDGSKGMFANSNIIQSKQSPKRARSNDDYDYLIIVGDIPNISNCQALDDFILWKTFRGYKTKMVSTEVAGTSIQQLKQYIYNEKKTKKISHVLFIGNQDKIPLSLFNAMDLGWAGYIPGDFMYGCLDTCGNIPIGRFPANTVGELTNMINKTIRYEKFSGLHSYKDVLLVAHQGNSFYPTIDSIDTMYNTQLHFTKLHGRQGVTNSNVLQQINEGYNVVNYLGHGEDNLWDDWNTLHEDFTGHYADSLNENALSIYFSIACYTGNIINNPCMMRSFLCKNTGAVAFFGATATTNTDACKYLNKLIYHYLLNEGKVHIGELLLRSHLQNIADMGDLGLCNAHLYLCGGDPTLEIWTDIVHSFDDYTLSLNGQSLTVNNGGISGYKVSIVNESGNLLNVLDSINSSCTFTIPTGNFYIVLNKHNYIPRVIYVNATDDNIQNKVFDTDMDYYYIKNATISAGYDVTTTIPYGNVSIENGSKLTISKNNGVLLKNGFECKIGGELQIK